MNAFSLPSLFFGIYLTVPFVLGCLLLTGLFSPTHRSTPSQRVVGILFIMDAVYVGVRTWLLSPIAPYHEVMRTTFFILDSTIISLFGLAPYTILTEKYPKWWMYIVALLPLALFPVCWWMKSDTLSLWSHMLPLIIGSTVLVYINRIARRIDNQLLQYFADPEGHTRGWVVYICISYLGITILSMLRYLIHGIVWYNMIITLLWCILVIAVFILLIRQQPSEIEQFEENEDGNGTKRLDQVSPKIKQRNYEDIAHALLKNCIEEQIYLRRDLSLNTLARECNTNRTYLSNYIREVLHMSFYEYINTLRLKQVDELLPNDRLSQEAIALKCGFNNASTMRSVYLKLKGKELSR